MSTHRCEQGFKRGERRVAVKHSKGPVSVIKVGI